MKDYKKIICLTAAVCLLGAAAFCGYHIYDHYAHEAEQTEAFEDIAKIVEQAQTENYGKCICSFGLQFQAVIG